MRPDWRANTPPQPRPPVLPLAAAAPAAVEPDAAMPRALARGDDGWTDPRRASSASLRAAHHEPQPQPPLSDRRGAAGASPGLVGPVAGPHESPPADQIVTPPPSDTSAGLDGSAQAGPLAAAAAIAVEDSQDSQLRQLSAVAAVQDRMVPDETGARKRMADGAVSTGSATAHNVGQVLPCPH